MEPVSAIALSLALGAARIAGEETIKSLVKDAYDKLKDLIKTRYPKVSVEQLEQAPKSKSRRSVVEEDLIESGAGRDPDVVIAAKELTTLIEQHAPATAAEIGVDLQDIRAANLRLSDITLSSPGTGVKLRSGTFTGDVDIHGVHIGGVSDASSSDNRKN
jgi:hypothetical protein